MRRERAVSLKSIVMVVMMNRRAGEDYLKGIFGRGRGFGDVS